MTPAQSRELAALIQTFSPEDKAEFYYSTIVLNQDPMAYISNNAQMLKVSFGGDRSEAGRYAANIRWQNRVDEAKDNPEQDERYQQQKIDDGPRLLLFGRDSDNMPITGRPSELRKRYGMLKADRENYFGNKYGVKVALREENFGSLAEMAQLGALQALEENLVNLKLTKKMLSEVSIGDPPPSAALGRWSGLFNFDTHKLQISSAQIESAVEERVEIRLAGDFDEYDSISQRFAIAEPADSEGDIYSDIALRSGYATMVHEFGHVVDSGGNKFMQASSDRNAKTIDGSIAPSGYGAQSKYEKVAESYAQWWLFGDGANQKVLEILFSERENVIKAINQPMNLLELPQNHPVIVYIFAHANGLLAFDSVAKASFGGDRSAAGRYAAEQRWKGHVKQEPSSGGPRDAIKAEAKRLQKVLADSQNIGEANIQTYGFLRDDVVFDGIDTYDSIEGLKMVSMGIPQQMTKDGKLRRQSVRWSEEDILNNSFVKIPSPELMRLEKQVNKLGQSALEYADAELKAQGVTEESVEAEKGAIDAERRVISDRVQVVLNAFNYMSNPDTSILTPEAKVVADRAKRIGLEIKEMDMTSRSGMSEGEKVVLFNERTQRSEKLLEVVKELNAIRDSYPELLELGAKEKVLQDKQRAIKSVTERRYEIVHNLLRETRTFDAVEPMMSAGNPEDGDAVKQVTKEVKQYIPSQIIDMVNKNHGNIKVFVSQGGGSFSRSRKAIGTELNRPYIQLHEYIHAIASATPLGRAMEQALLARRTIGLESNSGKREEFNSAVLKEGRQKVAKSASYKYGKASFDHIPDKFREPYSGRLYDHESAEVLTTGHDAVFSDDRIRGTAAKIRFSGDDYDLSGTAIGLLFTLGESQ